MHERDPEQESGPLQDAAGSAQPVRLIVADDLSRNRLTVFFRLLLVIPHGVWLLLWGIAALLAAIANWLATLVTGRPPSGLHRFLGLYVKYATHVYAYLLLAADPYPAFDGRPGYPVDVEIDPPRPQSRLTVAFRIVLVLPALVLLVGLFGGPTFSSSSRGSSYTENFGVAHAAAILGWFAAVGLGRMPRGLRDLVAWGVGYGARAWAYLLLLDDRYPNVDPASVLGELPDRSQDPVSLDVADDGRRSRLTVLFRLPLAVPHLVWLLLWGILAFFVAIASWLSTLVRGRTPAALHRFLSAYVRYVTHVYAFLALVANPFPGFVGARGTYPAEARIAEPARQGRWTVAVRLLLAIPALLLAGAYGALLDACAVLGWFASLATGRMPRQLHSAAAQALRYVIASYGYVLLLTGAYPYSGPVHLAETAPDADAVAMPVPDEPSGSAFG